MSLLDGLVQLATRHNAEYVVVESDMVPLLRRRGRDEPMTMPPVPHDVVATAVNLLHESDRRADADIEVVQTSTGFRLTITPRTKSRGASLLEVEQFLAGEGRGVLVRRGRRPWRFIEIEIGRTRLEVAEVDLITLEVEAIVNAAHADLSGRRGLDRAIHERGGPTLRSECRHLASCPIGRAVLTSGGELDARFVIHAVPPTYQRSGSHRALLASTYCACLELAAHHAIRDVAFPALSTGRLGVPHDEAATIALSTIIGFLERPACALERIILVLHPRERPEVFDVYTDVLRALLETARRHPLETGPEPL